MTVAATEKACGVDAFFEFNLEESWLGQASRVTPYEDVNVIR